MKTIYAAASLNRLYSYQILLKISFIYGSKVWNGKGPFKFGGPVLVHRLHIRKSGPDGR